MKATTETTLYEVGYILAPLLTPDAALEEGTELKKSLTARGAEITEEGSPKMIPLGYPMPRRIADKKFNFQDGFFGFFRFRLAPAHAEKVKDLLTKKELGQMLRSLFVTVDEKAVLADEKAAAAKQAYREANEVKTEGETPAPQAEVVEVAA